MFERYNGLERSAIAPGSPTPPQVLEEEKEPIIVKELEEIVVFA